MKWMVCALEVQWIRFYHAMANGKPLIYDRWPSALKITLTILLCVVGVFCYFFFHGSFLSTLLPLPVLFAVWAAGSKLTVLPERQGYVLYRGVWPWAKPVRGPISDFRDLRFYRDFRGGGSNSGTMIIHALELRFTVSRMALDLCTGERKDVVDTAVEFVRATGIDVVEDQDAASMDPGAPSLVAEVEARR